MLVVALVAAVVLAVVWIDHRGRENEWRHGGDAVTVHSQIQGTDAAGFGDALAAAGGDRDAAVVGAQQGFVLKVTWSGTPKSGGYYQFVLLDGRVSPARPVRAATGWSDGRAVGPNWAGAYESLHEHYSWLARTASQKQPDGSFAGDIDALGVPAKPRGSATLAYWIDKDAVPSTDPAGDLRLAMFFVDSDGEVRWAREIPLQPAR